MNPKNKNLFILVFAFFSVSAYGQTESTTQLTLTGFLQMVKLNHPVAKQADLNVESANANKLAARGGFDPKVFYDFRGKYFDSKDYYKLENGGLTIPTWFGIDVKGGYEANEGPFLNSEDNVPDNGLVYARVAVPLLQGLIIDQRRATLRQAKLFQDLSQLEKVNLLNNLLFDAAKTYWDWALVYNKLQIFTNAVDVAQVRFDALKRNAELGDRPSIDTVEAAIQLQERIMNYQQSLLEFQTQSLQLSNYLWLENNIPVELKDNVTPGITEAENKNIELSLSYSNKIDSILDNHPDLRIYNVKLDQLNIDRRLKQDKLKPVLDLNYNPLFNRDNLNVDNFNNYKWGINISFPLLLRKERGELQMNKIKTEVMNFEAGNKRNEIMNKIKATIIELKNYQSQLDLYNSNVVNYEILWRSEIKLFQMGESSLFMINSREQNYINSQIKRADMINKTQIASLKVDYSLGQLYSIY
jgi:outer membrane protein TolC